MNQQLYQFIVEKKHHQYRRDFLEYSNLAAQFQSEGLCPKERMTRRFELLAKLETPVLLEGEKICYLRTVSNIPDCFTEKEWKAIRKQHYIHELGYMSNLSPDYERILKSGLLAVRESADEYGKRVIDAILRRS